MNVLQSIFVQFWHVLQVLLIWYFFADLGVV